MNLLKVLGRIFLIAVGLSFIAGGGLCVALGGASGQFGGIALIGLVSLLLGAAGVWKIVSGWMAESRGKEGDDAR